MKKTQRLTFKARIIIAVVFIAILALIIFLALVTKEEKIGNVYEWDYNEYGICFDEYCPQYCQKVSNKSFEECEEDCKYPRLKLYSQSYCDIKDSDGMEYRLDVNVPPDQAITPQTIQFTHNLTNQTLDWTHICYGIFEGFSCD